MFLLIYSLHSFIPIRCYHFLSFNLSSIRSLSILFSALFIFLFLSPSHCNLLSFCFFLLRLFKLVFPGVSFLLPSHPFFFRPQFVPTMTQKVFLPLLIQIRFLRIASNLSSRCCLKPFLRSIIYV